MYERCSDVEQLVLKVRRRAVIEERSETVRTLSGRSANRTDDALVRATVLKILDSQPFKVGPVLRNEDPPQLGSKCELFRIGRAQHCLVQRRPNVVPVPAQDFGNLDRDVFIQIRLGQRGGERSCLHVFR